VREIVRVAENAHGGDLPKRSQDPDLSGLFVGAARGIRTPDPVITNDVLPQLSHWPLGGGLLRLRDVLPLRLDGK
jgi:hypothetical protein